MPPYFWPASVGDGGEIRLPQVDVVVVHLALQDPADALEAHAGVDVLGRQRLELAVGVAVELDEDQVPDLDDRGFSPPTSLPPDLSGVRSMWISVHGPHGPVSPISQKLSLLPKVVDVVIVHAGDLLPEVGRLLVARHALGASPSKHVTCRRLLSRPHTLVSSSQAQSMASALK